MKVFKKTPGITAGLRKATDRDLLQMEIRYPDDRLLPTMSTQESWVFTVGENKDAEATGFIEYFIRDSELIILGLWVAPDHRKKGYGSIMIELVEATEKPDITRAIVTPHSLGFYEKRGFAGDMGHSIVARVSKSLK